MSLTQKGARPRPATARIKQTTEKRSSQSGIGELEVMLVGARAVENLSDKAENVDSGNNDRSTSDDGHHGVERTGVFKRSDKKSSSLR